jgi:hypothetical protein
LLQRGKVLLKLKLKKEKLIRGVLAVYPKHNLSVMVAIEKRESLNLLNITQKKAKTCISVDVR